MLSATCAVIHPQVDTRVAVIYRRNRAIGPEGNTVIEAGDEVFFVARSEDIRVLRSGFLKSLGIPY